MPCSFNEGYAVVGRLGTETESFRRFNQATGEFDEYDAIPINLGRIDRTGNFMSFQMSLDPTAPLNLRYDSEEFDYTRMYGYYGGFAQVAAFAIFDTNGMPHYYAGYVPTQGLIPARPDDYGPGGDAFWLDMNRDIAIDMRGVRYLDANMNLVHDTALSGSGNTDWEKVRYASFYYSPRPFNQGLALLGEATIDTETDDVVWWSYGFVDTSGRWVIQPQFTEWWGSGLEYRIFNDGGLASVKRQSDGRFGAIDKTGRTVIPFQYDDLRVFDEGVAPFRRGQLFGYVDIEGNEVISPRFRETSGFSNGFAVAYDGTKAFLIDRAGNEIPGSDAINLSNYITQQEDGGASVQTPGEIMTIVENGRYGFGRLTYLPPLPDASEMNTWALEEVTKAIEEGLVPARLQNMYLSNITRGDFCMLIIHALSTILDADREELVLEHTGRSLDSFVRDRKFNDTVDRNVIAAEALSIVAGYSESGGGYSFRPYNTINRQEAAVMLWRAARVLGMDPEASTASGTFNDGDRIPSWALTQINYVNSIGVMTGVGGGNFGPRGSYTRQQSFMTIYRMLVAMTAED